MRSTSLALVSEAIALLDMCQREPGILVLLAETLGNPLELLVSKAHLSKAFREAAHAALRHLKDIDFRQSRGAVDEAAVAAVAARCTNLTSLGLSYRVHLPPVASGVHTCRLSDLDELDRLQAPPARDMQRAADAPRLLDVLQGVVHKQDVLV